MTETPPPAAAAAEFLAAVACLSDNELHQLLRPAGPRAFRMIGASDPDHLERCRLRAQGAKG